MDFRIIIKLSAIFGRRKMRKGDVGTWQENEKKKWNFGITKCRWEVRF